MRSSSRVRFSLRGIFLAILALSGALAILRATNYDLHHAVGIAASILGIAFMAFLGLLYFCDLVDITTWALRAWEKRKAADAHRNPPKQP